MKVLDELESKAKAATPGPFDIERRDDDCGYMNHIVHSGKGDYACCRDELDPRAKGNAAFIAAANPQTILALVEVVRAATVLRQRLEYPATGVGLTERRRELLAFDAALAKLEGMVGK